MSKFTCPVDGCDAELSKLQVMHFRANHDCDPIEWVETRHGSEIAGKYSSGVGCYVIADEYEWLSSDMVYEIVESRTHRESVTGSNNPMKRADVVGRFTGDENPAKRRPVRDKISNALTGHTLSEEAKQKISDKNSGKEISERHRDAISKAASEMDRSYMQTREYSEALSDALTDKEPTYPTPYEVEELSHGVRSSWEEEIGTLLTEAEIQYEYERRFELPVGSYYVDFVVDDFAIEVKGWANGRSVKKAEEFTETYPFYTYVVVGDGLPCDIHIPWDERSELLEVVGHEQ